MKLIGFIELTYIFSMGKHETDIQLILINSMYSPLLTIPDNITNFYQSHVCFSPFLVSNVVQFFQ